MFAIYNQNCFLKRVNFGKQGLFCLNTLIVLVYKFESNRYGVLNWKSGAFWEERWKAVGEEILEEDNKTEAGRRWSRWEATQWVLSADVSDKLFLCQGQSNLGRLKRKESRKEKRKQKKREKKS